MHLNLKSDRRNIAVDDGQMVVRGPSKCGHLQEDILGGREGQSKSKGYSKCKGEVVF